MTEYSGLEIQYEDFNKICRLCCQKSENLTSIYQTIEESSDNLRNNIFVNADDTVEMLLRNVGLSVINTDKVDLNKF